MVVPPAMTPVQNPAQAPATAAADAARSPTPAAAAPKLKQAARPVMARSMMEAPMQ